VFDSIRIGIDFGDERTVLPTHYTFCYSSSGNFCCPRSWMFQGTNDGEAFRVKDASLPNENPAEDATWETLDEHKGDASLDSDFASKSFEIPADSRKPFRLFRIVQTGIISIVS
jgi:hypothetical protein